MTPRFELLFVVFAFALLFGMLELARRRRVRGKYMLIWLVLCGAVLGLALVPESISRLAEVMGVVSGPNALFFVAITLILLMLVELSAIATNLHRQNRTLLKQVSLLTWRIEELEHAGTDRAGPPA